MTVIALVQTHKLHSAHIYVSYLHLIYLKLLVRRMLKQHFVQINSTLEVFCVPRPAAVPAVPAPAVFGVSDCPESPPASDTSERRASDSPSSTPRSPSLWTERRH